MYKFFIHTFVWLIFLLGTYNLYAETGKASSYPDGIKLAITNKIFTTGNHKIDYCGGVKPCAIDGKLFYGGRGKIPKTQVTSLTFERNGKQFSLDVSSMYNSGVTNDNIHKYISVERYLGKHSYRVVGYFGGDMDKDIEPYIVHWLVLPDGTVRNHISDYESLASLLFKVNEAFNITQ